MKRKQDRWQAFESRMGREMTAWVATMRPSLAPHLVPVWFVWSERIFYFVVATDSEQFENLRGNQKVAITLPDAEKVVIIEGEAHASNRATSQKMANFFYNKYEFDYTQDREVSWRLVEVTPERILAWGDGFDELGMQLL